MKLRLPVLILLLLNAGLTLSYLWLQSYNPSDNGVPESSVVQAAQRLATGEILYPDYQKPPYNLAPYTPIHYFLLSGLTGFFDLTTELILWGRRFTLLLTILIALLLYGWTERQAPSFGIFSALLFLGTYLLWPFAVANRPDILALLFSLLGLLIYSSGRPWVGLLLFVLAFFTKQSMIAAPMTVVILSFLQRDWRKGMIFGGIYAGIILVFLAILHISTQGLSSKNLIIANQAPFYFRNIRTLFILFLQTAPLALILGLASYAKRSWKEPEGIYFLVSLLFAIVSSGKLGSGTNYYLEPLVAACLLAPFALEGDRGAAVSMATILLIPFYSFLFLSIQNLQFEDETHIRSLLSKQSAVLTDNPRLAIITSDKLMIDPFNLSYLEKNGTWSSQPIQRSLQKGEIKLVVLKNPIEAPITWQGQTRLPQGVISAIKQHYRLARRIDGYYIYEPGRP